MRKLWLLVPAVVLLMLASAQATSNWKWRTHGGVYGSKGIAVVAHERILNASSIPQSVKSGLKFEIIRPGAIRPDTWYQEPYYIGSKHIMVYSLGQGIEWLQSASAALAAGEWDNVSYYLGVAAHYLSHLTEYAMHDNARGYYENLYPTDPDTAYRLWGEKSDHMKWQVEYYRPKDPALIVQDSGAPYTSLSGFVNELKTKMGTFIDRVMPPDDPMGGWFGAWDNSRKCESSDYSVYRDGNIDNVHYGSKELVDMATELVYSGWIYALDNQNNVGPDRITWQMWWSREHRAPGLSYA